MNPLSSSKNILHLPPSLMKSRRITSAPTGAGSRKKAVTVTPRAEGNGQLARAPAIAVKPTLASRSRALYCQKKIVATAVESDFVLERRMAGLPAQQRAAIVESLVTTVVASRLQPVTDPHPSDVRQPALSKLTANPQPLRSGRALPVASSEDDVDVKLRRRKCRSAPVHVSERTAAAGAQVVHEKFLIRRVQCYDPVTVENVLRSTSPPRGPRCCC